MEPADVPKNREFSHVRDDTKLGVSPGVRNDNKLTGNSIDHIPKPNNILNKRQRISEDEYRVEDFKHLIGTTHVDPENGLEYITMNFRKYGRLIAADRKLVGSNSKILEPIHALDIVKMTNTPNTPIHPIHPLRKDDETPIHPIHPLRKDDETPIHPIHPPRRDVETTLQPPRVVAKRTHSKYINNYTGNLDDASGRDRQQGDGRRRSARISGKTAFNTIISQVQKKASEVRVPKNSTQARKSTEAAEWIGAEDVEMDGLKDAECMIVVDLPEGVIPLDSKFVYALKSDVSNFIIRYKARLTGRGDQMIEGLEFTDSYSPVASWTGIRLFLALTVLLKLIPLQLDCDLAYINAPLDEVIYMNPPKGRELPPGKVWLLKKSLYGLKQSGRNWNKLFDSVLQGSNFNFHSLEEDVCLYVRVVNGVTTILFIYVDDIYIAATNQYTLDEFSTFLGERFKIKVLGVPSQLLGVAIRWGEDYQSVHLSIPKLVESLLADFDIDNMSI